jgi:hypothetical protein
MAEVAEGPVRGRVERPGRTRGRRKRYDERMTAARSTSEMLGAVSDYIRSMFVDYGPAEVSSICHELAEAADEQRRKHRGDPIDG